MVICFHCMDRTYRKCIKRNRVYNIMDATYLEHKWPCTCLGALPSNIGGCSIPQTCTLINLSWHIVHVWATCRKCLLGWKKKSRSYVQLGKVETSLGPLGVLLRIQILRMRLVRIPMMPKNLKGPERWQRQRRTTGCDVSVRRSLVAAATCPKKFRPDGVKEEVSA